MGSDRGIKGEPRRTSSVGGHASCTCEIVLIESTAFYTLLCHCVAGCEEYLSRVMSVSCQSALQLLNPSYILISARIWCLSTRSLAMYRVALRCAGRRLGIASQSERSAYRCSNTLRQVGRSPKLRLVPIFGVSIICS